MFTNRRIAVLGGGGFKDEYSLLIDGTDEYIECGDRATLDMGTGSFTVACWIKTPTTGGMQFIIQKWEDGAQPGWALKYHAGNKNLYAYVDDATTEISHVGSSSLINGRWFHVAFTLDSTANELYIWANGSLLSTAKSADIGTLSTSSSFRIGADHAGANAFRGTISDAVVYNTNLSASQMKIIYNGREPYNHNEGALTSNLVSWWRMGDGPLDGFGDVNGVIVDNVNTTTTLHLDEDFSATLSGWSANHSLSGGQMTKTNASLLYSNAIMSSLVVGDVVKFTVDTQEINGSNLKAYVGGTQVAIPGTGVSVMYISAGSTNVSIGFNDGDGSIFNSLKVEHISGNAGVMLNMTAADLVGDTP